jgi:hypothetical protein
MNDNDKVKLTIYTKSNGLISIITSRKQTEQFKEDILDNISQLGWVEVNGRIDCADGNELEIVINREDISGFDILELNNSF